MKRKLLIFGNGLGMSLDPVHFSLDRALNDIWEKENFLSEQQKTLIQNCIDQQRAPKGEEELDILHQVVTACKALNKLATNDVHWLSENGQSFPEDTAKYIHKVATDLHNYDGELPKNFEDALVSFVKESRSHVATLNYDKLLYSSFINNNVFDGYSGYLVDGMITGGFSFESLERLYGNSFGYYLHLHGSPLFLNKNGTVKKLSRDDLTIEINEASEHIVLTHVKHKPSVIAASHVLSTYWDYLKFALSEAEEIILFGYSGLDEHLNKVIRLYLNSKPLKVVEWSGAGEQVDRVEYWSDKFGQTVSVTRLDNITDFTKW
jgi:hypothetical protein